MNTYSRDNYYSSLCKLLSLDFNCLPEDFEKDVNVLTVSKLNDGGRSYFKKRVFFRMATTGQNAVVTSDECLHDFLKDFIRETKGHLLFEFPALLPLEKELNKYGYSVANSHHMFLPHKEVMPVKDYSVKWFYGKDIQQFYGDERFPNAIASSYNPMRPDTIVVCAYDGNHIMGMAGCSMDAPHWQQIGIDVMQQYRSMGVGTYLVTLLKNEILKIGDMPFYGTNIANYHSWNIALNCGFRPAWVEIMAKKNVAIV